ncbi:MAG TPA: GNAT family N-acetyltransferase [Myxococcota bacterium]|nr:GNAT family N-acetyltransferase [Myxococcota bacterium]
MTGARRDAEPEPSLTLGDGVAKLAAAEWNALVGDESPFLEWEWLASLEEAGCVGDAQGWQARPLLLRQDGRLVAACPLYVKSNSEGEFVFDWGWADAAARAGIAYYPKLLVGVPFTPVTGARFLCAPDVDRAGAAAAMARALRELCAQNELSSVHVNFCREDEIAPLESAGYLLRIGFQYHWRNEGFASFDDYLLRLRSKRRNQVRRERRGVAEQGVVSQVLRGDAIPDSLFEPMYRCYRATVDAHYYGRRYLNRRFFALLAERFRHRLCFVVARRGEEVVGGTLNVVKGDALYGRYWGGLDAVRYLHFDVCYYAAIEHCIEAGLARFEPGAGGDYKFLRGFDARPTFSLHHLADPRLRAAVARFLQSERARAGELLAELARQSARKALPDAGLEDH